MRGSPGISRVIGTVSGGRSRLHLIDLGSCEKVLSKSRDGGGGLCLSLNALGNVIMALANGAKHVPYRYGFFHSPFKKRLMLESNLQQVLKPCHLKVCFNSVKSALQGQQTDHAFEGISGQHQLQNDHDNPHLRLACRLCRVTQHNPACISHPPHEKEKV